MRAEILFPFAEQRILIPKAKGYVVRTKIERAGPRAAGEIGIGLIRAGGRCYPTLACDEAVVEVADDDLDLARLRVS